MWFYSTVYSFVVPYFYASTVWFQILIHCVAMIWFNVVLFLTLLVQVHKESKKMKEDILQKLSSFIELFYSFVLSINWIVNEGI